MSLARAAVRFPLIWTTSIAAVVSVLLMQALTTLLVRDTVLRSAADLEAHEAAGDARRLAAELDGITARSLALVGDYARWDATYAYALAPDDAYFDVNLSPQALDNLGLAALQIVDDRGTVLKSGILLGPDRHLAPVDASLAGAFARVTAAARARPDHRAAGVATAGGRAFIVAAQAITPSDADGPVGGWMAFADALDGPAVEAISTVIGSPVHLGASAQAPGPDVSDVVLTEVPLAGPTGEPELVATIQRSRTATARAEQTVERVALIAVVTGGLMLAAVLVFLRRVVRRIQALAVAARDAGARPVPGQRVAVTGQDEIGAVGAALNEMLEQRERAEQLAASRDRLLMAGTMAAGVAHEINNPLSYLVTNLTFVTSALPPTTLTPELTQALDDATFGADRIAEIIRDLRLFSGRDEVPSTVNLREVVESATRLMRKRFQGRVQVVTDVSDTYVSASESALGQILVNLTQNALQALPENDPAHAHITIRAFARGEEAVLEVEDNGTGIPPEVLPRIFEPFFTARPVGIGTGLGLSVCHGLAEAFGGRLTVETQVGVGTRFALVLPRVPPPPRPRSERPRLLLVDDDPMARAVLVRWLKETCELVEAPDALVAEALWREQAFDAGLFDVVMPGVSGIELYKTIVAADPSASARIGFVTGGAISPEGQVFLRSFPERILSKPYTGAALHRFVESLVTA